MKKINILISFFLFFVFIFNIHPKAYAQAPGNSFITIVNPVRISTYVKDPAASVRAEYDQVKKRNLPATWLLTYDVIANKELASIFSDMNDRQELGIFLEVTKEFCKSSNVVYNSTNSWHRATSLFFPGYTQEDRKKLVDTAFSKFKEKFGYFPKSVGAWWVDSYSLVYMQEKYGITGTLGVSDQYDLDGYQVWGTPWSIPYYPSKINAAIPAASAQGKLDLVSFRWAPRDPLNGYLSPTNDQASLYSTQDYTRLNLSIDYFQKIVKLYSQRNSINEFGQATVGVESDYQPEFYSGVYSSWLDSVQGLAQNGVVVTNMKDFAKWYRVQFTGLSPAHIVETDDLLGKQKKVLWFQNNLYRVGFIYNKEDHESEIIDFRVYPEDYIEPFYTSPNKQYGLSINLPYIIDTVIEKNSGWKFNAGKLISVRDNKNDTELNFENGKITFGDGSIIVSGINVSPRIIDSKQITIKRKENSTYVYPKSNFYVGSEGILIRDYSFNIPFTIEYKIEKYKIPIAIIVTVLGMGFIRFVRKRREVLLYCSIVVLFGFAAYFLFRANMQYYVSQTEVDALSVLARLPEGKVLVYDKDCIRCLFTSKYKPASAAGKKGYIGQYSNKNIFKDFKFVTAKNSQDSKEFLREQNIKYIYLTKYENYIESLPYPPEDMGLKRVYENGNAEIWSL